MTEEENTVRLAGVRAEREVYVKRGLADRVAACDAEIARLERRSPAHQARAVRRPRSNPQRETR